MTHETTTAEYGAAAAERGPERARELLEAGFLQGALRFELGADERG